MSTGKTNPKKAFGLLALPLLLASTLNSDIQAAPAPVEESKPMGGDSSEVRTVVSRISDESVTISPSAGSLGNKKDGEINGTAHLLNTIDQVRQEMMEMRGQLEEQAFRIEQLQQEGRDRYLDLDERISRLNDQGHSVKGGASGSSVAALQSPMVNNPVTAPSEKSDQSPLKAEEAAYQSAFALIRSKQFDQAKEALQQQLIAYPQGRYADNAYYWLGEVDMAQGRYDEARDSFQVVLSDFPKSPKIPDASYKLGRVYDLLGNQKKAKELLKSVVRQYPESAASRLSDTYLRTMGGS
ncbi:tol-pal system protein YbgF [Endozoicomonas sp.]|uniref:tol-pal system protein YbgF n=1 Tax=Endozoicomonas sp. TaxID=1892382 RepID=UPI00383B780B